MKKFEPLNRQEILDTLDILNMDRKSRGLPLLRELTLDNLPFSSAHPKEKQLEKVKEWIKELEPNIQ